MKKIIPLLVVIIAISLIVYVQGQSQREFCNEELSQCNEGLQCINGVCIGTETGGINPNGGTGCLEGYTKNPDGNCVIFSPTIPKTPQSNNNGTQNTEQNLVFIGNPTFNDELNKLANVILGKEKIVVWNGFPSFRFGYNVEKDVVTIVDDEIVDNIVGKQGNFFSDTQFNYIVIRKNTQFSVWEKEVVNVLNSECDTENMVAYIRQKNEGVC